jgi:aubergine-like protein
MPRMAELALEETGRFGLLRTRPATCVTSVGTVGTPVKVLCNYFSVLNQPDWKLYQYRVDYIPNIESKRLRIALLKDHEQTLFPHSKAFDGTMMFTTTLLRDDV